MKGLSYVFAVIAVVALGFWVYHENYATRDAIAEARGVSRDISRARERLGILEDEWAYLNRPDRLRALVVANYDRLGLDAMSPDSFGSVEEVAFPPPPAPVLPEIDPDGATWVSSDASEEEPL